MNPPPSVPGRREPAPLDQIYLVADLGGTQTRTAVFDLAGEMLSRHSVATPRHGGRAGVVQAVIDQLRLASAASDATAVAVGISALGPVDPRTGTIRSAPTLPDFDDVPLAELVEQALQLPVSVVNDANAATMAEWKLGAGRGLTDFVYVTVSTGIGCGLISNGRLVTGRSGYAGELGRVDVHTPDGTWTRLEELSSGTAIAQRARALVARPTIATTLRDLDPDQITAGVVAQAARDGDRPALDIITGAATTLGIELANLSRLVDPEVIAVGGGVVQAGPVFLDPLESALTASLGKDAIPPPRLTQAELGGNAELLGAVLHLMTERTRTVTG